MEACFLTSRSFTKTTELVPSIKARILNHPKRFSRQFKCRLVGSPFLVSCKCFNFFITNYHVQELIFDLYMHVMLI